MTRYVYLVMVHDRDHDAEHCAGEKVWAALDRMDDAVIFLQWLERQVMTLRATVVKRREEAAALFVRVARGDSAAMAALDECLHKQSQYVEEQRRIPLPAAIVTVPIGRVADTHARIESTMEFTEEEWRR